ncbi:MAG: 50S ribosomal protein L31 [Bacteroidetes bacterium QH_2_63_10]|nr:MAG: 50S ribosomal protein L31 [Bacteroidetes bacterium QH_2_63_10]
MKDGLHPEYNEVTIKLADGSEVTTRSTMDEDTYESEIDSSNHPFYTGRRQFVDTAGSRRIGSDTFGGRERVTCAERVAFFFFAVER